MLQIKPDTGRYHFQGVIPKVRIKNEITKKVKIQSARAGISRWIFGQTAQPNNRPSRIVGRLEKRLFSGLILRPPHQREVYQRLVYHQETSEMKYCENSHKNISAVFVMEAYCIE